MINFFIVFVSAFIPLFVLVGWLTIVILVAEIIANTVKNITDKW